MKRDDEAIIFNIQRFSVHDGPGIRTTVFLKGCPLACLWCANPESQRFTPDLVARDLLCKKCGACVKVCPRDAITLDAQQGRVLDRSRCDRCMLCAYACLYQSLTVCGRSATVGEVMEEVLKDKPFYANSGGGITVSGGECLSQSEFVYRILERSKIEGLHTALDTSGFAPWSELERVLPLVDLLLFDLKHLDSSRHKNATGVGNETIIYNLKAASALTRTWLRVPLIAGFNDGTDHIQQVARIGKAFGVEKLSFLPYHEGGKAKSIQLGFRDNLADFQAPSDARLLELKELGENEGVPVTIGK